MLTINVLHVLEKKIICVRGERFLLNNAGCYDITLWTGWLKQGFPDGANGKESTCQRRRYRFNPCIWKIPGGGNGNPLQYSCLKTPWTKEPGRLQSMWLQRVRHNSATEHVTMGGLKTKNLLVMVLSAKKYKIRACTDLQVV